ncbi:helix-turn-helix domain-containing protein [Rhodococcus sp. SJ-2]
MDKMNQRIATAVRAAITTAGLNENAVADATGIPRVTLRRRLNGSVPFNADELVVLARVTGADVNDFLAPIRQAVA